MTKKRCFHHFRKCEDNYESVTVSVAQAKLVEEATRKQPTARYGLTRDLAPRLHSILHTNHLNPSVSLVKSICYPGVTKFFFKGIWIWMPAWSWCEVNLFRAYDSKPLFIRHQAVWVIARSHESFYRSLPIRSCWLQLLWQWCTRNQVLLFL